MDGLNQGIFPKIRKLFPVFEKGQGTSSPPPSSYAPVVTRKCKIPLLTIFTIMKLKTNVLSVSMIFL